jgi:sugar phosphate isomerase/epimerase
MRLGIDSFSVRSQGWNAYQIIDYAVELGLENVHFSERAHAGGTSPESLAAVREYTSQRNLTLELGMRSFNRLSTTFDASLGSGEQQLIDMIEAAKLVGSPIVRCFAGMQGDRSGPAGFAGFFDESVRVLKAAAPRAEEAGIYIAVENHGGVDFLASELLALIESVGSSHVRVCLDTGNPMYAAEDAVQATEILAPYVVSCHLRDTLVWLTPDGAMAQWVPAGRGSLDHSAVAAILNKHAPGVPLDLEVIAGGPPRLIPIYDPDSEFWKLYPDMKASAFARFLDAARAGTPGPTVSEITAGAPTVQKQQQLDDFEESLRFVRRELELVASSSI